MLQNIDWTVVLVWFLNILKIVLALCVLGGAVWFALYAKRYDTSSFTLVVDPNTNKIIGVRFGKAGTFEDKKSKNKLFFLKGKKAGLDPDKTPYLPVLNPGVMKPNKVVMNYQYGENSFRYISPSMDGENLTLTAGEEDVNWALNTFDGQKKMFGETFWEKLLPYMPLLVVSFFIVIMLFLFLKNMPVMIDAIRELTVLEKTRLALEHGTVIS